MLKIATILPYKENYTYSKAAAASLWVSDFFKYSKYKKNNYIFGSTDSRDYLSKNYVNIDLKNNNKLFSTTAIYCDHLIKKINNKNFDIIEIHNRPLVFLYLKKYLNTKYIIYFHNDPLSMKGSKKINERIRLLNETDKIIFVSKWVQKRFFIGIDKRLITKTEVVYPSINIDKKKINKTKRIVFVGKLNPSKGYDIYRDAITKILNEFKGWKAFSIGDESRNKPTIKHKNHLELGYLKHKIVLNFLKGSEIAVVPSRWEEPFGRTALEASSRGCATIISNRGGLQETTDHCIILESINSEELYKQIKKLIINKKLRNKLQIDGSKYVKHVTKDNSNFIDQIRSELIDIFKINLKLNNLKILNIYNIGQKLDHRLYNISIGKKFTNGFIRNGNDVIEISDRDFVKQNRGLNFININEKFQNYLISTFKNYHPQLVFFGHTNNISLDTLEQFKKINKNVVISQWNEDPMMPSLKDSKSNIEKIQYYNNYVDYNFITTDPSVLKKQKKKLKNTRFLFIPVDKNIECYNVYKLNPRKDLFYAMSHGVNRATLKSGKNDSRIFFLNKLISKMNNINYDFYGFENKEPIWGNDFYTALINSKMGLNLSRGQPTKYYSSNRIASLMGNGLLTFIDKKTSFDDIFNKKEIVFYSSIGDLAEKITHYKLHDNNRRKIAKKGQVKYFKLFNEKRVTKYIIDNSFDKKVSLF